MLLIVGVDPGTCVGWAVLDLNGNIVDIGSQKSVSLDLLVSRLHKFGDVILVGCDKFKVPFFVQSFATKVGARVFSPKFDLSVDEKRSVVKNFGVKKSHEIDALASALCALNSIKVLVRRVISFLDNKGRLFLFDDIFRIVFKEGVSIQAALVIAEPKNLEKGFSVSAEIVEKDEDVLQLYQTLKSSRREVISLRSKNKLLSERLSFLARDFALLKNRSLKLVRPKSALVIAGEKEARIRVLSSKVCCLESEVLKLKKVIVELKSCLFSKDFLFVRSFKNFSLQFFEGCFFDDCVIFVDNPNEFSVRAVDLLKKRGVSVVLFSKEPSKKVKSVLPFVFISGVGLVSKVFDSFVCVDKVKFDKAVSSSVFLENLIGKYKSERSV